MNRWLTAVLVVLLSLGAGCSDEDGGGVDSEDAGTDRGQRQRPDGETPQRDQGVRDVTDDGVSQVDGDPQVDVIINDTAPDRQGGEDRSNLDLQCTTDDDGDGYIASICGGTDCNDQEFAVNPGLGEICDYLDNDCFGGMNDGIECTFYAHTDDYLYLVDPFLHVAQQVTEIPDIWDMDTHPDGTLYGGSASKLYSLASPSSDWVEVGDISGIQGSPNGLAIDLDGNAFLTSGNFLYSIDLSNASTSLVGAMGGGFISSGDCVVNKDNSLFMSSKHRRENDALVLLDATTGTGAEIGFMGVEDVFGLTAAWGFLFGLTQEGHLIEINESTGEAELLWTFPGLRWYGAASTPGR